MKTLAFALAATATLVTSPAFAGLVDEVAQEKDVPVQVVAAPEPSARGQGAVVNGETDGALATARIDGVRFVPYPESERPPFDTSQ